MIRAISDLNRTKRAWFGSSDKEVSSYSEDMALLFDSFGYESFIDDCKAEGIDPNLVKEMEILRDMLNAYTPPPLGEYEFYTEDAVIRDPKWLDIVEQAKRVVSAWTLNTTR